MPTYNYKAGLGNVGSYQVAGIPYVTGGVDCTSATRVSFPSVTSWVAVTNHDATNQVRVGFSQKGVDGTNYFRIHQDKTNGAPDPYTFKLKVTEIWISGSTSVDVCAGLTGITTTDINNQEVSPDGSNWSGSAGALVG
jgi:hypothetical protein